MPIHTANGAAYPDVLILVTTQPRPLLQGNLRYTGIMRAKRLRVRDGRRKALTITATGEGEQAQLWCLAGLLSGAQVAGKGGGVHG